MMPYFMVFVCLFFQGDLERMENNNPFEKNRKGAEFQWAWPEQKEEKLFGQNLIIRENLANKSSDSGLNVTTISSRKNVQIKDGIVLRTFISFDGDYSTFLAFMDLVSKDEGVKFYVESLSLTDRSSTRADQKDSTRPKLSGNMILRNASDGESYGSKGISAFYVNPMLSSIGQTLGNSFLTHFQIKNSKVVLSGKTDDVALLENELALLPFTGNVDLGSNISDKETTEGFGPFFFNIDIQLSE